MSFGRKTFDRQTFGHMQSFDDTTTALLDITQDRVTSLF
jgi:hypothetical protein